MLVENRLFPSDHAARSIAVKLYEIVSGLPIISPHGHCDPRWFAENESFPNPSALFITPDHYVFRMLYSQGVSLESLGVPDACGNNSSDPREVWRIFAKHYFLFRGTPTRLWLDYAFEKQFGLKERLSPQNADAYYDLISKALETPEFRPGRCLKSSTSRFCPRRTRPSIPWRFTRPLGSQDGRAESCLHSAPIQSSTQSTQISSGTSKSWERSRARTSAPTRDI